MMTPAAARPGRGRPDLARQTEQAMDRIRGDERARPAWRRYGAAVLLVLLASLATAAFHAWLAPTPTALFLAAVALAAWYGGVGPAAVAAALSLLPLSVVALEPLGAWSLGPIAQPALVVFVLVSALLVLLSASRDRAEHALRASQERLRLAQEAGNVGVWGWDGATGRTSWSETMWSLYGLDPAATPGNAAWLPRLHPDDRPRVEAAIAALLASGETEYRDEFRVVLPDGGERWLEAVARVARDAAGRPVAMSGVNVDVTDRRRAEAALREGEGRLRALLAQLPVGVGLTDDTGRWVLTNPAMARFVGEAIPSRDPRLRPRWQAWDEQGEPLELSRWPGTAALRGETVTGVEFLYTTESGAQIWTQVSAAPFRDGAGAIAGTVAVIEDIDARKRAEQALAASRARYRTLFEGLADAAVVSDGEGRYLDVNPAASAMLGYTREELLTFRAGRLTVPPARAHDEFVRLQQEGVWRGEIQLRRKDDKVITVESWVRRIDLPEGPVYSGTMRDVTERKRQEAATRLLADAGTVLASSLDEAARVEQVARLAVPALADSVAVYLVDDGGGSRRVGLAHADPGKEALLRELESYVPGADHPRSLVGRAIRDGEATLVPEIDPSLPETILPPAPRVRELVEALATRSVMIVPLLAGGTVFGAMVFNAEAARGPYDERDLALARELAGRVAGALANARLYRQAREAEARVSRLFDTGVIGLMVADAERIVEANDRFLRMVGRTRQEVEQGRLRWAEMTPPEYAPRDAAAIAEIAERGYCSPFEKEYLRPDGGRVPILIGAAAVRGTAPPWICGVVDLSAQKAAEQERAAFVDAAAHDLKNPLASIKGQVQLLRRRTQRAPALEAGRLAPGLAAIEAGADRMIALIDELMDAARLRSGQALALNLGPTDLVALARACASEVEEGSGHTIVVEADEPALVGPWDRARLERVVQNLLANAVKYSPAGSRVVVRVSREADRAGAGWACLAVRDEGVGIPVADLPHVFERFRRGGNVGGVPGTGIGLAGAQAIVAQHIGTIAVDSEEGVGSTFTVRLPLEPRRPPSAADPSTPGAGLPGAGARLPADLGSPPGGSPPGG